MVIVCPDNPHPPPPLLGTGFGIGLRLGLGLWRNFLQGNCPRTGHWCLNIENSPSDNDTND